MIHLWFGHLCYFDDQESVNEWEEEEEEDECLEEMGGGGWVRRRRLPDFQAKARRVEGERGGVIR